MLRTLTAGEDAGAMVMCGHVPGTRDKREAVVLLGPALGLLAQCLAWGHLYRPLHLI